MGRGTDCDARVLRNKGAVIAGLYACGNDRGSSMTGNYPGPGITLGRALTFGYIAGRHLAQADAEARAQENGQEERQERGLALKIRPLALASIPTLTYLMAAPPIPSHGW